MREVICGRSNRCRVVGAVLTSVVGLWFATAAFAQEEPLFLEDIDVNVPHVSADETVKWGYDIVYVRAPRAGDEVHKRFYTDFSSPVVMEPGADLMLLHPNGSEELLVAGGEGSITDPFISLDGEWAYYVHIHYLKEASQWSPPRQGADVYKIHLKSKKIVRLTNQRFSPNTGAGDWTADCRAPKEGESHEKNWFDYGVYNMGPCPLPGGRIVFTSNREGFRPAKGYPAIALQLFVMDDRDESIGDDEDPTNLRKIGHLNISGALHPVVLADGRIMYSTLESQGIRGDILWGIWTIHPDGTNWNPLISAFDPGGAPNGFHFQTQLSNREIVIEEYYNQNNSGFGAYIKLPAPREYVSAHDYSKLSPTNKKLRRMMRLMRSRGEGESSDYPAFGPAFMHDSRNKPWRYSRFENGKGQWYTMPFLPTDSVSLTPFTHGREGTAGLSKLSDKNSPEVGKFTHPSGAPDNHLLTIYSPGPVNHQYKFLPQLDGGIYLIKNGDVVEQPADLRLIKNDPNYNECWPRAVVPYKRIYGVDEPRQLDEISNDGLDSEHLPAGTPFGLVGSASLYKRESYPNGVVPEGSVTARYSGEGGTHGGNDPWKGLDAFTSHGNGMPLNWHNQGADAGLYANEDIHAIRILAMEPTTDRHRGGKSGRQFYSHALERLRILGEIPVRKFASTEPRASASGRVEPGSNATGSEGTQPLDPDGNPDTSFLAKIPADTAYTFQTLDKEGMVLNMAQTWHQSRPGEIRTNCGGCHAHSQLPTDFSQTMAAHKNYEVWDLVNSTPLLTAKENDDSGKQWDAEDSTGVRTLKSEIVNVEYHRDVKPILMRSCVACHTAAEGKLPAGNLNLDADAETVNLPNRGEFPGTYYRLALDEEATFGYKPVGYDTFGYPQASRYVRKFQSRRSLLAWKLFGQRLDGFSNDDHPSESKPGVGDMVLKGEPVDIERNRHRFDIDFAGSVMPPPDAVAAGKVAALSDEDRRTLIRWIDLGCPIDLDFNPATPDERGKGWMLDDNRPILTIAEPAAGDTERLDRIVIGLHDYYTGIDAGSFSVTADFELDGLPAGEELAAKFKETSLGVWQWQLDRPLVRLARGKLTVSVKDRQGNFNRQERTFRVGG